MDHLRVARLLVASTVLAALACGCSSSRTIIPYKGPDGRPIPFVYRHTFRVKDSETREPVPGALVGVKSSDDGIWQIDWTGENGGAELSQEYAEAEVYNDQRSLFFVNTQNTIVLKAPAFHATVRHPAYEGIDQGYGGPDFLDRPRNAEGFAYAELVRPRLVVLDRKESGAPAEGPGGAGDRAGDGAAGATRTAAGVPVFEDLTELPSQLVQGKRKGGIVAGFGVGPGVHGGRFTRSTGSTGGLESATKVYYRAEDEAYVVLAAEPRLASPVAPEAPSGSAAARGGDAPAAVTPLARMIRLCEGAEVVLHSSSALAGLDAPGPRWVAADRGRDVSPGKRAAVAWAGLDGAVRAGGRRVALVYPLAVVEALDPRLKEAQFDLVAEWWQPMLAE